MASIKKWTCKCGKVWNIRPKHATNMKARKCKKCGQEPNLYEEIAGWT